MKKIALWIFSLCIALKIPIFPQNLDNEFNNRRMQVVIIAITEFDDERFYNPSVSKNIIKVSKELKYFFENNFQNSDLHYFVSKTDTTSCNLRNFLRKELPKIGKDTLTLIFVLSHGALSKTDNPIYSRDVIIHTSDSKIDSNIGNAIYIGRDLIEAIGYLAPGSVVLAFLDLCHSGAADNLQSKLSAAFQNIFGVKMFVMASSLPEKKSYSATFTKALLKIWQNESNSDCLSPYQSELVIAKEMRAINSDIDNYAGHPVVLIPFYGNLCLESFALNNSLLTLYNPTTETVYLKLYYKENNTLKEVNLPIPLIPIKGQNVTPIKLNRGKYIMKLFFKGQQIKEQEVDLEHTRLDFEVIETPNSLSSLGLAFEKAAKYGKMAGIPTSQTELLLQRAYAAYVNTNNSQAVNRLYNSFSENLKKLYSGYQNQSSNTQKNILSLINILDVDKVSFADNLVLLGDYYNAAVLYESLADEINKKDAAKAKKIASLAYYSYGAAVKPEDARRIRITYKLSNRLGIHDFKKKEQNVIEIKELSAPLKFKIENTTKLLLNKFNNQ